MLTLFGDAPRARAASPDGSRVYAASFASGNQTTAIPATVVKAAGVTLLPDRSLAGELAPPVSQIVRFDAATGTWRDDEGRDWSAFVPFSLPDEDVFGIDANAAPEALQASVVPFAHVGTVLFNLLVNPVDAAAAHRARAPARVPHHRDRSGLGDGHAAPPEQAHRLRPLARGQRGAGNRRAQPGHAARHGDRLGRHPALRGGVRLERGGFVPSAFDHIAITGGGPPSLALDEARGRLYVLSRFAQSISVVDVSSHPGNEIAVVPLPFDAEPPSLRAGRRFLYDARESSSNGEASCASCHVFGHTDGLSWNRGNPDGVALFDANPQAIWFWGLNDLATIDLVFGGEFLPDDCDIRDVAVVARAAAALAPGAAQTCRSAVYCADDADADGIGDACDLEP